MSQRTRKQMIKILQILDKEGVLSNVKISEKADVPYGTVRCYTSFMNQSGLIRHHKDMRGIFELTQEGRDYLRRKEG